MHKMEAENWSVRLLVDAKTEYSKQLLDLLTPRVYEGITSLYEDTKQNKFVIKIKILIFY